MTPCRQLDLTVRAFGSEVDLIAVERTAAGDWPLPELTRAERLVVVRQLLEEGHGPSMVARRLGVSGATARRLTEQARSAVRRAGCD